MVVPKNLKTPPHASAIVDGMLCQFTATGDRAIQSAPLGSAVVEFRHGPLCFYVRELAYGLLPGLANLYCLDADLRLQWIAAWPFEEDPCAEILQEESNGTVLLVRSVSGVLVRLSTVDGRLLSWVSAVAEAG